VDLIVLLDPRQNLVREPDAHYQFLRDRVQQLAALLHELDLLVLLPLLHFLVVRVLGAQPLHAVWHHEQDVFDQLQDVFDFEVLQGRFPWLDITHRGNLLVFHQFVCQEWQYEGYFDD